jgi:hypothetical protein
MPMPMQQNSVVHLRVLIGLADRGITKNTLVGIIPANESPQKGSVLDVFGCRLARHQHTS